MKTFLIFDFKRGFFSKKTLIASLIVVILSIGPYYGELKFSLPKEDGINFFLRIGMMSYLALIAPLVASIPFSNSYILDKEKGILTKLFTSIKPKVGSFAYPAKKVY